MSLKPEQLEYSKFRKSLDKAIRDNELIKIDYEYNLGKKDVIDDSRLLLKHLIEIETSLKKIREQMK